MTWVLAVIEAVDVARSLLTEVAQGGHNISYFVTIRIQSTSVLISIFIPISM